MTAPALTTVAGRSAGRRMARSTIVYAVLIVGAAFTVLPFWWVLSAALRSSEEFRRTPGAWLPETVTLDNFVRLFAQDDFGRFLGNSLIVAAIVVAGNVVAASLAGYAIAKLDFPGKRLAFGAVMASLMVPFSATFVPQFLVTVNLGLADTLGGIALPSLVLPISIFIMRQFAFSVPDELLEAARLDGASEARVFFGIFLPLAGPALATVTIMSFLASWNNFLWPLVVALSDASYTLPVGLATLSQSSSNVTDYGLIMAGAAVVMLPVLALFALLQRYFVQGIAAVGLK